MKKTSLQESNLRLLSKREAARRLNITPPTLYSWIQKGYVLITSVDNREYIREEDLEQAIQSIPKKREELTVQEMEREIHHAIRRGKKLQSIIRELKIDSLDQKSISNLARYLYEEQQYDVLKGAISI